MINYLALRYRGEDSALTLPGEPMFPRKKEEAEEEPGFSPLAHLYESSRPGKKGRSVPKGGSGETDDNAIDAQVAALRPAAENGGTAAGETDFRAGTDFWAVLLDGAEPTILAALVRGGHGSEAALWSGGGRGTASEEAARRGHTAETLTAANRRGYAAGALTTGDGSDRISHPVRGSEARRQTADLDRFTQREARRYDGGFVIY